MHKWVILWLIELIFNLSFPSEGCFKASVWAQTCSANLLQIQYTMVQRKYAAQACIFERCNSREGEVVRNSPNPLPFCPAFKILSKLVRKASVCTWVLFWVSLPLLHKSSFEVFWSKVYMQMFKISKLDGFPWIFYKCRHGGVLFGFVFLIFCWFSISGNQVQTQNIALEMHMDLLWAYGSESKRPY